MRNTSGRPSFDSFADIDFSDSAYVASPFIYAPPTAVHFLNASPSYSGLSFGARMTTMQSFFHLGDISVQKLMHPVIDTLL